jgi:hypothetical protein
MLIIRAVKDVLTFSLQEQAKNDFRYVMYGTIDKAEGLDPKGEFFCKFREHWMPEIPGKLVIEGVIGFFFANRSRNFSQARDQAMNWDQWGRIARSLIHLTIKTFKHRNHISRNVPR